MNSRQEWFRNAEWSAATERAFWRRLERSRSTFHKAQYLRIQALHLQQAASNELLVVALQLIDHLIDRYPEPSKLALAHQQRGTCLARLGRVREAFDAYRASLAAERSFPGVRTGAALDFGAAALRSSASELHPEILAVLEEFEGKLPLVFPVARYRLHGIRAAILSAAGRRAEAVQEALLAEAARVQTQSGLRYHQDLGLVRDDSLDLATSGLISRLAHEGAAPR